MSSIFIQEIIVPTPGKIKLIKIINIVNFFDKECIDFILLFIRPTFCKDGILPENSSSKTLL